MDSGRQGYDPEKIIIGGVSAGANLLTSMMLKLRDTGRPLPRAAFCISIWGDMAGDGKSFSENFSKDVLFGNKGGVLNKDLKKDILTSGMYSFVGDADRYDPYVSPVYGDFTGFPPMFFTVGGDEMLLDDTLRIVEKLKALGISADYDIRPEMFHVYTILRRTLRESCVSYEKILSFLQSQSTPR